MRLIHRAKNKIIKVKHTFETSEKPAEGAKSIGVVNLLTDQLEVKI